VNRFTERYEFSRTSHSLAALLFLTAKSFASEADSLAELERWILQARWGPERIIRFRTYMKRFFCASSRDLIVKWAEVMVAAPSLGRRIEVADALVTTTALLYDGPLVTNNPVDYVGVAGINPVQRMNRSEPGWSHSVLTAGNPAGGTCLCFPFPRREGAWKPEIETTPIFPILGIDEGSLPSYCSIAKTL
jgi:predicted nucleic acid-binding protein